MCECVFVYVRGEMKLGWTEGEPVSGARPSMLELPAVVVFTLALWSTLGILGQAFTAKSKYLVSCHLQKWFRKDSPETWLSH